MVLNMNCLRVGSILLACFRSILAACFRAQRLYEVKADYGHSDGLTLPGFKDWEKARLQLRIWNRRQQGLKPNSFDWFYWHDLGRALLQSQTH
jgi:hypothetical protein